MLSAARCCMHSSRLSLHALTAAREPRRTDVSEGQSEEVSNHSPATASCAQVANEAFEDVVQSWAASDKAVSLSFTPRRSHSPSVRSTRPETERKRIGRDCSCWTHRSSHKQTNEQGNEQARCRLCGSSRAHSRWRMRWSHPASVQRPRRLFPFSPRVTTYSLAITPFRDPSTVPSSPHQQAARESFRRNPGAAWSTSGAAVRESRRRCGKFRHGQMSVHRRYGG
jgi:hypothetical protein